MGKPTHFFAGLLTAAAVAAFATTASAQADRDAAISKCAQAAQAAYPGSSGDAQLDRNRTSVYKACMTQAGFLP